MRPGQARPRSETLFSLLGKTRPMLLPSHLAGCDGGRGDAHSPLGRQRHPRHGRVSAADGAREMSPTATEHCPRPRFHSHATRICATSFPWQPPGVDSLVPPMCRLEAVTRAQGTGPPLASGEAPLGRVRAAPSAAGAHCLAGPPRWGSWPGVRVAARSTLRNADAGLPAGWTVRWVEGSHEGRKRRCLWPLRHSPALPSLWPLCKSSHGS